MAQIGSLVRYAGDYGADLTKGKIYTVLEIGNYAYRVRDDVGDTNWIDKSNCEEVNSENELTELRAFKAAALIRFPALAEPETDSEAAERFANEWYEGSMERKETILAAFAWARANPR